MTARTEVTAAKFVFFQLTELTWSWIPKNQIHVQKKKENVVVACLRPTWNVKRRSRSVTAKKCTKKARCTLLKKTRCFLDDVLIAVAVIA